MAAFSLQSVKLRAALALCLSALSVLAQFFLQDAEFVKKINRFQNEQLFHLRGPREPSGDVVLIRIDEPSYEWLDVPMNGAWPRQLHSDLLAVLTEAGAKRVIFDILFLGSSGDDAVDATLAEAFSNLEVYLGSEFIYQPNSLAGESYQKSIPFRPFLEASKGNYAIVHLPVEDGRIRQFYFPYRWHEEIAHRPTLAEAALGPEWESRPRPGEHDLINFYGRSGTIPSYSFHQVLFGDIPASELKDKIVYVGLALRTDTGPAQKDSFLSPYDDLDRIFGVEIHAIAADNLLHNRWIRALSPENSFLLWSVLQFVLVAAILFFRPFLAAAIFALCGAGWAVVSYSYFLNNWYIGGATTFVLYAPLALLLSSLFFYFVTRRQEKRLQGAFEHYVSPQMVKQLASEGVDVRPGGELVEATALFSDIVNFSDITDGMPAADVSRMLNAYFDQVAEAIFIEQGTLLKFIGDAAFAIWGAPLPNPKHFDSALRAAEGMQERVRKFNQGSDFPKLETRIGLHSGTMLVGNLGSSRRFDYTAVGDTVNVAARLEGLNKKFGTRTIFSESLRAGLTEERKDLLLGTITVKGKQTGFEIFTFLPPGIDSSRHSEWLKVQALIRDTQYSEAYQALESLQDGDDIIACCAANYLTEMRLYSENLDFDGWSGQLSFTK